MPIDFSRFLNSYRNKLLAATLEVGISLSTLEITEGQLSFTITVKDTGIKFTARQSSNDLEYLDCAYTKFKPGLPEIKMSEWTNIDRICEIYKDWLAKDATKALELTNIPDQWAELMVIQPIISSKAFTQEDFEIFTENEKQQIQDSLKEFQRLIKDELDPMKEKLESIQVKLDYLSASLSKLNRFDWKGVALSTVIGIATNLSVDTSSGKQVFDLFQQAFGTVIRLLPK
jgi:hypothetical protein